MVEPSQYRYYLQLTNNGKPLIQHTFENIEEAVRMLNTLADEWHIVLKVVETYASGERNNLKLELQMIKR